MNTSYRKPCERPAPRIAALPKLPVFFDLAGRPAVVIGGTEAAAWKAELLAAAGARVRILAADLDAEAETVVRNAGCAIARRAWQPADLAGAALVVADAESDDTARTVRDAAGVAGVPINVVDRPAFCDFQFGSIVNRAPVVVGISTDGAAPVLGQAIRRRIETILPRWLGAWADAVKSMRGTLAERMPDAARRRRFWDRFAERAFAGEPGEDAHGALRALADGLVADAFRPGRVTLVGAGPGDAEHLTLKAVRALQAADVILFDDLVSDDVLELARREAKRMLVGKRGGRDSCSRDDINALMVRLARQGKRVVRLKSGDPMMFGRAGEEIAELEDAGVAVDVVSGVTAATAMAARLKTSLTHRDRAQSVSFVTGHARAGGLPDSLAVAEIAGTGKTAVIYMGGDTADALAGRLIARGVNPATPAIAMRSASRRDEAVWSGVLSDIGGAPESLPGDGPILIGIGAVFGNAVARAAPAGVFSAS